MATYQAVIDIEANNLQQAIDAFYSEYGFLTRVGVGSEGFYVQEKGE